MVGLGLGGGVEEGRELGGVGAEDAEQLLGGRDDAVGVVAQRQAGRAAGELGGVAGGVAGQAVSPQHGGGLVAGERGAGEDLAAAADCRQQPAGVGV